MNQLPSYYNNVFTYEYNDYKYQVYVKYATDLYDFDFICQVFEIHDMLDKAEYAYARKVSSTGVNLILDSSIVDTVTVEAYDDAKYTPEEYVDDVLEDICEALRDYNKDIEPIIEDDE